MFRKYIFIYISLLFVSAKAILFLPLWLGCLLISLYFDCSARTSSTLWNRSGESGHLCFVSVCKGKAFNLSPLNMTLALSSLYMASITLSYVPSRRRQWHPTPVLLPGKSHGWRSLMGCSPWGRQESDMTEWLPFHFSLSCFGEGNGNPLQRSCLESPRDRGAWWAAVYGVAQSRTRLKRLSSSSSMFHLYQFVESFYHQRMLYCQMLFLYLLRWSYDFYLSSC